MALCGNNVSKYMGIVHDEKTQRDAIPDEKGSCVC